MKRGVAVATMGGGTPAPEKTTEEQARAIMCVAQRAVEEEAKRGDGDCGATPDLSLKKSLQWFLEGRKNKNKAMAAAGGGGTHRQLHSVV
ncbi:unnamed protein product [Miscanthus lutarioriparius]|uniref:Uncharacterized protein n=1 Tax=Miscanthus lutarioriparius TaxID=422564 RepID=A0A811SJK1_9POAL|nr:unnamed protein product [Miscanthus lutarioriparius]